MFHKTRSSLVKWFAVMLAAIAVWAFSSPAFAQATATPTPPVETTGSTATSTSPDSASAATQDPGILISRRTCRPEIPAQIRLETFGGNIFCYGGAVGDMEIGDVDVVRMTSGGYTGAIGCDNGTFEFTPGVGFNIVGKCFALSIEHG